MFSLINKDYEPVMDQDVYIYQNEDKVTVKIWVSKEEEIYLDSKIFSVIIDDPLGAIYGMSLSFSLNQFSVSIDRPISYPIDKIDAVDKNLWRQKEIAEEVNAILDKYR